MPKPPTNNHENTEVIADPENDRRRRRNFTTEEKLRILKEADLCKRGELSALLRHEGIYSSQLGDWRKALRMHGEAGLSVKTPGRKPVRDERERRSEQLEREKAKLERKLLVAQKLNDLAGKAHEILGVALPRVEDNDIDDSPDSSNSDRRRSR